MHLKGCNAIKVKLHRTVDIYLSISETMVIERRAPYFLSFTLDIRYGTVLDTVEMLSSVEKTLQNAGFTLAEVRENKAPFRLSEDSPEARAMLSVYRAISGDEKAKPYYSGGGTYARHLPNAFSVGCAVPYLQGDLAFPAGHGEAHQSDECIFVDALIESAVMITMMSLASLNLAEEV